MAIWQEMLKIYNTDMCLKFTDVKLQLHLPGANESRIMM